MKDEIPKHSDTNDFVAQQLIVAIFFLFLFCIYKFFILFCVQTKIPEADRAAVGKALIIILLVLMSVIGNMLILFG